MHTRTRTVRSACCLRPQPRHTPARLNVARCANYYNTTYYNINIKIEEDKPDECLLEYDDTQNLRI